MMPLAPAGHAPEDPAVLTPAIVLSAGTAALGVIRSLGQRGVPVIVLHHDPSEVGCASRWVHEAIRSPHPEQEKHALLGLLHGLAARFSGAVVMALDRES